MKKVVFGVTLCLIGWSCSNLVKEDSRVYDIRAVQVLDSLSDHIGELRSVSYTLNTVVTEKNKEGNLIELIKEHDVYMRGPNKMHIHTKGDLDKKSFWYNGEKFAYYSHNKNEFDTLNAPPTIMGVIDSLHSKFNIDFPAADFFYPTLTDDILRNYDKLLYWGETIVDSTSLHTISAYNENYTIQVWVNVETKLPAKFIMFKKGEEKGERYEATFSNWKQNPNLPDLLFEFSPSASAIKVELQPKKQEK